jgi:hypothetical protein
MNAFTCLKGQHGLYELSLIVPARSLCYGYQHKRILSRHIHVCVCVCVCVCMYVCMYVCICIYIYVCIYIYICIQYIYTCIYVYIYINTYIHLFTHMMNVYARIHMNRDTSRPTDGYYILHHLREFFLWAWTALKSSQHDYMLTCIFPSMMLQRARVCT